MEENQQYSGNEEQNFPGNEEEQQNFGDEEEQQFSGGEEEMQYSAGRKKNLKNEKNSNTKKMKGKIVEKKINKIEKRL